MSLGPCKICGESGYSLSFGGPDICPSCDCGVGPEKANLKRQLAAAEENLAIANEAIVHHNALATNYRDALVAAELKLAEAEKENFALAAEATHEHERAEAYGAICVKQREQLERVLTVDVKLEPATYIKAGCKIGTVVAGLCADYRSKAA